MEFYFEEVPLSEEWKNAYAHGVPRIPCLSFIWEDITTWITEDELPF
jgi:hypothetical protein